MLKLQTAQCQGFRGGGSGNFGYDASSACSKPYSRAGRARFENLPCDFKRQNWCTVPGSAYPWQVNHKLHEKKIQVSVWILMNFVIGDYRHAVRRFVQENQGLMRRMYGDERHISVLRAEIENNDVDESEIDDEFFESADDPG